MTEPASTLLIDDEPYLKDSLSDAFEDDGLALDLASTWAEGMDMYSVIGHELVIADYDLQESQTGLRLLAEIKKLGPSSRLILISGRLTEEANELVQESNVVDLYITKTDPKLLDTLLGEAKAAHSRSLESDWPAVGADHPRAGTVDLEAVGELEGELRLRLRGEG